MGMHRYGRTCSEHDPDGSWSVAVDRSQTEGTPLLHTRPLRQTEQIAGISPVPTDPVQQVQLGQLVVTDDFDSDDEVEPVVPNKSNSTLQLVKTRIRRHISQETLGRGKGRSAVGSSEEEVARRAELKRLMHKRIQEELRSEESRDVSSHVSPTNRTVTSVIDPLPGGGPRDTLEFSFLNALQSDDTDPISPTKKPPGRAIAFVQMARYPVYYQLQGHYSSNTTERYDTPKSGKSNSCDTSFHSCPAQSRPQSGTMLATEETIYGDARDDIDSKSDDATVIKTSRSASGAAVGAASKFKTWSGRARTQPVLMQSTIEFGRELEGLLQLERERILGRQHGGANRPGLANG
ncbi:hypothetical protein P8C59_006271 [Phyllachora maydis]|uniref:Uncharacterized protein n=1 Tax=Phyllachora maydis TaxID=1825666 RepID=A0AAD9MFC5_9PEZI|nr:hypothetical protein P8C59_006271 [Phyllachora maydis]